MMLRDGITTSLWQFNQPKYRPVNVPDISTVYDVAIIGGGITGITTALLLQKAGKKCIVIEKENLCYGTTGGTTAHLNSVVETMPNTLLKDWGKEKATLITQSLKDAIALVKSHVSFYNIDCGFEETTAYFFSQTKDQSEGLDEVLEACREVGLDATYSLSLPFNIPFDKVMEVKDHAKLNPVKYVYALAEAFEEAGGVILQHTMVTGVEDTDIRTVETENGNFRAANLVYATHIPPGVNLLHLRCVPMRSYVMAFTLQSKKYPDVLAYDMYDPYHYIRSQNIDGENYMIVGGEDHKTGESANAEASFLRLESYIRKHFDVDEIPFKWSAQFFDSADGVPYIGNLPGHPGNIFVATGYCGNGITYSQVAAIVLRDMILEQENPYIEIFNPNRLKPVAGFSSFIKHNVDVVKQFVGKWFDKEKLEEFVELAPGEGKVVKYEGEKIALYKDEHGELHAVDPICTHLKCQVSWNNAEKSWDCACHGSRFSYDGKVLTGPADRELEKIAIRSLVEH